MVQPSQITLLMKTSINHKNNLKWWIGAILCAGLTACSFDSTIQPEPEYEGDVPMQFFQAAMTTPVTRAVTANYLTQGFMVSCWKGFGGSREYTVMDRYEVRYNVDTWSNLSRWDYVGTTSDGYYKDQAQRYWDSNSFPYRFYALSPCPPHAEISGFSLTPQNLTIPSSVSFIYQTCSNGLLSAGAEPYMPAQVECPDGTNNSDTDLLNGNTLISKDRSWNGASTLYDRYVALPFHHITSKVRFAVYNTYRKETPEDFHIYNIKVKAVSADFITEGKGYTADLANSDMLNGTFTETVKAANDAERILLQTDNTKKGNLNTAVDRAHAYYCECPDGMLQIPQTGVRMTISFDVYGLDYKSDFTSPDGQITYDKASKTIHYTDVPVKDDAIVSFDWESNNIYTYIMKISEFYPLTIDCTAELTPWTNVCGSLETNLEQ